MPKLTLPLFRFIRTVRPLLDRHRSLRRLIKTADMQTAVLRHSAAAHFPILIQPQPRQLTIAVTAHCNLRCLGCRYERDFMLGEQLPIDLVSTCLEDARAAGVNTVRLFGGEPLLHRDLPGMVEYSVNLGLKTYVTTNGILLGHRIDDLYRAGLRFVTVGFYGTGEAYDSYVQRRGQFAKLDASIRSVRERHGGDVELQLNYLISRPTCSLKALHEAWAFAERHDMFFHIDMVSFSVPFFTDPGELLQFRASDAEAIGEVCAEIVQLKHSRPDRILHSIEFLRSIPDWLTRRAGMQVPCDAYELLWVGADGTVQLCDTHFKLGNLHKQRLKDILYRQEHKDACRDAFLLNCPNCMCKADGRVLKHASSRRLYSRPTAIG